MRTPRRIIAGMEGVFFGHLALWPDGYTSGSYAAVADAMPLRWWGATIALSAIATAATRSMVPLAVMVGLLLAWTGGLVVGVLDGQSQSPAGWTFQAGILALLFWGVGRQTVRHREA